MSVPSKKRRPSPLPGAPRFARRNCARNEEPRAGDTRGEWRRCLQTWTAAPPWETGEAPQPAEYASVEEPSPRHGTYSGVEEIPICQVEELAPVADLFPALLPAKEASRTLTHRIDPVFRLPPTDLLNEAPARNPYDEQELKDTASRIKAKFEEFNVLGNVVQINPGPVVTTFEFKPEAGIKYAASSTSGKTSASACRPNPS